MFGTWKYDPETAEVQNLRKAFDPITARSSQHQACDRCHEKKLKCSGEKDGCERCVVNELGCEYTRTGSKGSRRGKKSSPRLGDGKRGSTSTTASVSPNTQDWPSPERSRSSRSRQARRSIHKTTESPMLTSQAAGEGVLGQLGLPSLSPESSFETNLLNANSLLPPRTVVSASPSNYATSTSDQAAMLAFGGMGSHTYPPWPDTTGYDMGVSTSASLMPTFPPSTAPEIRPFMPPSFEPATSYPGYDSLGGYSDTDFATLDPRFWPPSTQPGP